MAFDGFSKNSGPATRPGAPSPFGNFPRPPSPSPVIPGGRSSVDYSDLDAPKGPGSPLLAVGRSSPIRGSSPSFSGMPRTTSPPLRWGDTNAIPSRNHDNQVFQRPPELLPLVVPSNSRTNNLARIAEGQQIGRASQTDSPYSNRNFYGAPQVRSPLLQNNLYVGAQRPLSRGQHRPFSSPVWGNQVMMNNSYNTPPAQGGIASVTTTVGGANQIGRTFHASRADFQAQGGIASVTTTVGGANQIGRTYQTSRSDFPVQKRTRSPTLVSDSRNSPGSTVSPSDGRRRSPIDYSDLDAPETMPSRDLTFDRSSTGRDSSSYTAVQKSSSSPIWHSPEPSRSNTSPTTPDDSFLNLRNGGINPSERVLETKRADVQFPKRTRSPVSPYRDGAFPESPVFPQDSHERALDPQIHKQSFILGQTSSTEAAGAELVHSPPVKKTRLPLVSSLEENLDPALEIERELNAKAKRLARFKEELREPNSNGQGKGQNQSSSEKQRLSENPARDANGDSTGGGVLPEYEGMESSSSIIGLCSDMCPESERAERERKGDLDQYERVDGDRNLSSEFLAVKKYTRTAEREAELIRPLPILQKTMGYLLDLLDKPYDDRFLGLYNFLWDRMRAIRMDLRMQHIFNLEAISMLEQMIRLHIIAMHELCEYTKGEGFSEGFDAHLNIEQMNKASVELFQFYDDHRKKGIDVPSEREFRGYYALLKLDKHPGYKVEPAELSLDLAKMSPEMRQSTEVLFARDVARACRTGNFIAFFRLARKASYLQACLMHAHFSKLRTQALASLHSGLQNNQGIPIDHIAKWLGMEEEDIENLVEYHGFSVKDFKEPYMMKENAFINVDSDFPVKRSKLVERKRSRMIVHDVSSPSVAEGYAIEKVSKFWPKREFEPKPNQLQTAFSVTTIVPSEMEMDDPGTIFSPKGDVQKSHKPSVDQPMPAEIFTPHDVQVTSPRPLVLDFTKVSPQSNQSRAESVQKPEFDPVLRKSFGRTINSDLDMTPPITLETAEEKRPPILFVDSLVENQIPRLMPVEDLEDVHTVSVEEDSVDETSENDYYEEVAEAKLKLILRLWKRRSAKKREVRERKLLAADVALSSLSLGPPMWQNEVQSGNQGMFSIDDVMSERHEIQKRSRAVLNPSNVIATQLSEKNPDTKCLCWKLVLCSQDETPRNDMVLQSEAAQSAAYSWLHSKLIPANNVDDHDLLVSSHGLAIWRTWIPGQTYYDLTSCLSVVCSSKFEDLNTVIAGANAVLYLLSEHTPWGLQKNRLHNLVSLIPSGSRLPLLILSGSAKDESDSSTMANDLGLEEIDKSRVAALHIIYLKDQRMMKFDGFFSSERLTEGLKWLASETSPQICIYEVKTRELVLSHLNSTLDALDEMNDNRIGPNNCVTAFNVVLDLSVNEVASAARANPTSWPCPEIELLEESSDEYRVTAWYLPTVGWSSHERTEAVISALTGSKLAPFTDDLSWLSRGVHTSDDIENRKWLLENCLISYLTDTSQMMNGPLAQKEASIMLQKCTQLKLHNTAFYLVPNWIAIFRRIINWRLMNLTREDISSVYVLGQQDPSTRNSEAITNSELRGSNFFPPYILQPSLDELFEVSCNPHESGPDDMDSEPVQPWSPMASDGVDVSPSNENGFLIENEEAPAQHGAMTATDVNDRAPETMPAAEASRTASERLREMFKTCNMFQDMIDKKLSIYF